MYSRGRKETHPLDLHVLCSFPRPKGRRPPRVSDFIGVGFFYFPPPPPTLLFPITTFSFSSVFINVFSYFFVFPAHPHPPRPSPSPCLFDHVLVFLLFLPSPHPPTRSPSFLVPGASCIPLGCQTEHGPAHSYNKQHAVHTDSSSTVHSPLGSRPSPTSIRKC